MNAKGLAAALFVLAAFGAPCWAQGVPALKAGEVWTEFLQTPDLDKAVGAARGLVNNGATPRVMRRTDGSFAVVTGPKRVADQAAERRRLAADGLPEPVGFSRGETFAGAAWAEKPPEIVAQGEARTGKRLSLRQGDLTVSVDWRKARNAVPAPIVRGEIGGRTAFETQPDEAAAQAPFVRLRLLRLDARSPRPSVVFTAFTGGAHCCILTTIATQGVDGSWRLAEGPMLDGGGFAFEDIDGDGAAELVSVDNSFLYAFASYAESAAPLRIHRIVDGALVDVTRRPEFQSFLRQHVYSLEFGRTDENWRNNGFLGGWVAAKSLIGEGRDAWARMEKLQQEFTDFSQELCPDGSEDACADDKKKPVPFKLSLERHLQRNGYGLDAPGVAPK